MLNVMSAKINRIASWSSEAQSPEGENELVKWFRSTMVQICTICFERKIQFGGWEIDRLISLEEVTHDLILLKK